MRARTFIVLVAAAWQASCSSCRPPEQKILETVDAPGPGPDAIAGGQVHKAGPPIVSEATMVEKTGEVRIERAESSLMMPGLASMEDSLFVGDSVSTGADGRATIDLGLNTKLALGPASSVSIGIFRPQEVVLRSGTASLSGEAIKGMSRRFLVMTPGGIVFHAGPAMDVAVAADGEVRVDVVDCPPAEPSAAAEGQVEPAGNARCGFMATGEEQGLATGDRLVIGSNLAVKLSRMEEGGDDPASWIAKRKEALASDPARTVKEFAGWAGTALGDLRTFIDDIKAKRERSKELIRQLRDLRKQGKPEATDSAAAAAKKASAPTGEITLIKEELTANSADQLLLRHRLLARWYQLSLRLELLAPHLTDEALAASGEKADVLRRSVEGLGVEIHELFTRRPKHQRSPIFAPKESIFQHGVTAKPKKPVAKAP